MAEGQGQRHGWTPAQDTPRRWPLIAPLQARSPSLPLTKDARLINAYAEFDATDGEYWIYKRLGLGPSPIAGVSPAAGLNLYTEPGTGVLFAIFGPEAYCNAGPGTPLGTLGPVDGTAPYFFETINPDPLGHRAVVMGNGKAAYVLSYTSGPFGRQSFLQITDPDFPTSFVPGFVYLDGTLYVMDQDGNIFGSDINQPASWDGLNKIEADSNADLGVALIKQLNYVIALKQYSTQVFYDAEQPVGSPLGPVQDAQIPLGCLAANSVQSIDNTVLWLTSNETASPQIVQLDNLTPAIVSSPAVERILDDISWTDPLNEVRSWVLKHGGHRFYGLNLISNNITLVYDIDQRLWYIWSDYQGNFWPIVSLAFQPPFMGSPGLHIAQHSSNGALYLLDGDYEFPNDDGKLFPVDIYTPNFDAGVDRRKLLNQMRFNADQKVGSVLQVRYSDDDFQSWSNFRSLSLGVKRPILSSCGTFYRRAYHFRHQCNTAYRIKTVDLQMALGSL
jgi:hypothetical protein